MARSSVRKSKTPAAPSALALILIDGAKIRRQIRREYEKVRRDLQKAREQVEQFEKQDLPGFNRWFNHQFGALLSELHDTNRKFQELQRIVIEIETEVLFNGVSPTHAYARIMEERRNAEKASADPDDNDEEFFDRGHSDNAGHSTRGHERFAQGEDSDEFFGFGRRQQRIRANRDSRSRPTGRLKELYRALARRLHPDAQQQMTAQKQEWWHQAQAAYEKGDVEQLEAILSLCEMEDCGATEKTSLSVLQRITAQLKKSLRQMKRQVAKHRREPAWNFKQRTDLEPLATTMRRQMTHDLNRMKEQLRTLELHLGALAKPRSRRRAPWRTVSDP